MKNSMMLLKYLLCFCLLVKFSDAAGQENTDAIKTAGLFKHIQDAYSKAGALSYKMKYTYANEGTPGIILDSLSGAVDINGSNYRSVLDNTETISNGNYAIMLFRNDKIMYLAKAAKKQQAPAGVAMLDSTLTSVAGLKIAVENEAGYKVLTLAFPAKMQYKQIQVRLDTLTGFITQLKCIVKSDQMVDPQVSKPGAALNGYDEYAVVNLWLYDYQKFSGSLALFDEHTFFIKDGKEYKTTETYKDYKIFLGTPNL